MSLDYRCINCLSKTYSTILTKFSVSEDKIVEFNNYLRDRITDSFFESIPLIHQEANNKLKELTGIGDAFYNEKQLSNQLALSLYTIWKPLVDQSTDPFDTSLRLAIAGNIVDYGTNNPFNLNETIEQVMLIPFKINHSSQLKERIKKANQILYLGDNAGEIFFDKLFIETIEHQNIVFAVKQGPILNDATLEDAITCGLDEESRVITNGFDAPSTLLEKASPEFIEAFNSSDLIISKGQGNFEGLLELNDSRIFFLLTVKCEVIAEKINTPKGSFIVLNKTLLGN